MEHQNFPKNVSFDRKTSKKSWFDSVFAALVVVVILSACNRPLSNPETIDPIYADLVSRTNSVRMTLQSEKYQLETVQKSLAKADPRGADPRRYREQVSAHRRRIVEFEQELLYLEVRAKQRQEFVQKDYLRAFNAGEDWPSKDEVQEYFAREKLRRASRRWDDRVPKLTRHLRPEVGSSSTETGDSEP